MGERSMLAGKKVVVVGGSSGIGLAAAELAKAQGAEVIVASRNADKVKAAASQLGAKGIPADVTNDQSVADLFRACGPVDHVVVSAAQLRTGPFKTVAMDDVRATLEAKLWGAWRCARAADIKPGGSLTLVSGFLSIRPRPNSAIVSASNGALESLTRALALELAPVRVQLRVARHHRYADPRRHAGSRAQRHAGENGGLVAGQARRDRRGRRPADPGFHDQRLHDRLDRLSRRRRPGRLTCLSCASSAAGLVWPLKAVRNRKSK
jgi:NAD(P)-dependent dehydrogenase (short-subunit alcohol dehydrogenase family)